MKVLVFKDIKNREWAERQKLETDNATKQAIIEIMERYNPQTSEEEINKCINAVENTPLNETWTQEVREKYLVIVEMARQFALEGKRFKQKLIIPINAAKRDKQVADITESDFFTDLQKKARELRNKQ